MKVTSERHDGQVVLSVEIEPERVEKAKDQAFRRLADRRTIPGFRKGKAPRAMLERVIGAATILDEAMQQLVPVVYKEAVEAQQIRPIAEPAVKITGYDPVTFQAVIAVPPTTVLGDYRSIRAEPEPVEVTPEDVEAAMERVREQHAAWEPVERPVELGDSVTLDLKGTRDGEPFVEESDMPLTVGAENRSPVPGVAEALVGAEIGQPKEIDLAFPADYEDERLAGKAYHFTATVHEVKARRLPNLDDAFAPTVGEGLETLAQLRERVEQNLRARAETDARARVEQQAVDRLVEISQIEFPPVLVDRRIHEEMEQRQRQLKQYGLTLDQWLKYTGKTPEQYHEELEEPARLSLRRDLAIMALADAEEIAPAPEEIGALARRVTRNVTPDELEQMLRDEPVRSVFSNMVLREKAIHRLVELATEGRVTYPPLVEAPAGAEMVGAGGEREPIGEPPAGEVPEATAAAPAGRDEAEAAPQARED